MSGRISTLGMHLLAVSQMQARQVELSKTQQQLATMRRVLVGRDDPIAAGVATALERARAEHERYGTNADLAETRLQLEETALVSLGDRLVRMREIAIQANNATHTADSRRALLAELREHRRALVALGNASDGQGRFLFAGTADGSAPFVETGGAVSYVGDQTRRQVEVAPEVTVVDSDPGSEIFMRVRTGDGQVAARAAAANTGTAVLRSTGFVDASQWDGGQYRIEFAGGNYQVLDAANTVVASGAYASGQAIVVRGYQVTLEGAPADGDRIDVGPAPARSLFETVDALIAAVQMADTPASTQAAQQNAFYAAIQDLDTASDHVVDLRSSVGARLATLEASEEERNAQIASLKSTLSELRDLDYAEATSRLARESAALEAARLSYMRIQSLSLFSMLR
jgi:flagellar hook-associated protein 3 FlgL